MKKGIAFLTALGLTAILMSCAPNQTASNGKLKVAASFYPLAFFSEKIGDGLVSVTQITPGGVEPHDYDPSPQQLASVHDAQVFVMNGEGVDSWGDKVIDELKKNGVVTVRMVDTITPLGGFNENGETDPTQPSSANASVFDPHIWLDPVLAEKEVTLIRDAFIHADSAHADQYTKNADQLLAKLSALDQAYRSGLAQCTVRDIVTSHNAFRYLSKEYRLTSLAIAGIDPEQEPTPKRVAELADFAKKNHITYIFFESLVSPKIAQTVANEIGAQTLVLNPIEGLTSDDVAKGESYLTIMQENLQNLRTALRCQ